MVAAGFGTLLQTDPEVVQIGRSEGGLSFLRGNMGFPCQLKKVGSGV